MSDLNSRLEMADRENSDLQSAKNRAAAQITELAASLEDAEYRAMKSNKEKKALEASLEEANDQVEIETRGRQKAAGECRGLYQDLEVVKAELEDEQERSAELQRRLYAAERRAKELAFQMH